jgi:glyoxylase-like metal-dependent hydrolase (beta-lactamase superfamily II)
MMMLPFLLAGTFLPLRAPEEPAQSAMPEWCRKLPRPVYKTLDRVQDTGSWFEVYRIRPGVYALYEPHQWQEVISYLIVGSKRALLFDTGMGISNISEVVARLTPLPVTVLNSHTHHDHVGGNAEFKEVLGLDLDYTRGNARGKPHSEMQDEIAPESLCGSVPQSFDPAAYVSRPFQVTRFVKDGDIIDLGDRKLEVITTPGHTPDSICLIDWTHRLLWTGDTYYPGPIYLFVPETNFAAYVKSVDKLAALAGHVDVLMPAHNEPVAGPSSLVKLQTALRQVQSGHATFKVTEGKREYVFDGFSLLMPNPDAPQTAP